MRAWSSHAHQGREVFARGVGRCCIAGGRLTATHAAFRLTTDFVFLISGKDMGKDLWEWTLCWRDDKGCLREDMGWDYMWAITDDQKDESIFSLNVMWWLRCAQFELCCGCCPGGGSDEVAVWSVLWRMCRAHAL